MDEIKSNKKAFGIYLGKPSTEQLNQFFYLHEKDLELMDTIRLPATRLGFAIQLGSLRFLGTFISDITTIPQNVLSYVAIQLNIDPGEIIYYSRRQTRYQHIKLIKSHYGYHDFSQPKIEAYLANWLLNRALYTTESSDMLFDMLLKKCLDEKIILPGVTTFSRFIATAVEKAEEQLYQQLALIPTEGERKQLLNLLELVGTPVYGATIKMDILRTPLVDDSHKEISRGFDRLKQFQTFSTGSWKIESIPEGKIKVLANYAFKAKAQLIQRMSTQKKLALIVAFVYVYKRKAMDEQILALSNFYETIFRRAKNTESRDRLRTIKDLDRAASTLSDIVEFVMSDFPNDRQWSIRDRIFEKYSKENVENAVSQVKLLVKNEQEPIAIAELLKSYRKFRRFIPDILTTLTFDSNSYGRNCEELWIFIDARFPKPITASMVDSIEHTLPKKWLYYIREHPEQTNKCVLIAAIELLIQSLKRHDIYLPQSILYNNPMDCLIDEKNWLKQKDILLEQLALPSSANEMASWIKNDLELSYKEALNRWPTSKMARIENTDRLIISRLKKAYEKKDEKAFRRRIQQLLPKIDLSDLLLEVNQQLNLTQSFNHLSDKDTKMKDLDISLLAVLLSEACNIGFSPVSKEGFNSLKYDRLVYVNHHYIRVDTLSDANQKIIHAHRKLATSKIWGDGHMASADGIRYVTPQRFLYSRSNPKYFGRGRGITFYNFVSDQYIGFHGMVVSGTLRDSLYLLEGFLNQPSELAPNQIMTDTAGYSDMIFGLFGLLGFQFSPRIANDKGTKLWRINANAHYGELDALSQNTININLICTHWKDILRVAGSLKSGKVNATELTKSLQRNGKPTSLGKAITEYGKVYKTKHQLRYISDEIYARQILEQLNKGEARHALCRNIFYGRKGKLYQTYYDGMEEQLNALSLVTNAIIYWNSLYLEKVFEQMKAEGYDCSEEVIRKQSPLISDHINFVGKYTFRYEDGLSNGELRPLNIEDF
ncbi:Tn3 family transposase [Enterococcus faecalis]|nr:Tn3 family transposase [Enterococcus faecalis]